MITNEEAIDILQNGAKYEGDENFDEKLYEAKQVAIAALKAEPCVRLKLDGMLEDAYEHGYQQARYDYEVQPCEDAVSRQAVFNQIFYSTDNSGDVELGSVLRRRIENLPPVTPKQRWIPVSEGLPEDGERVLVTYDKIVIRATWDLMRYRFYDTHAASLDKDFVYAWMPLPAPYKAESEDKE